VISFRKILVLFKLSAKSAKKNFRLIQQIASADIIEGSLSSVSSTLNVKINFDDVKERLIEAKVKTMQVPIIRNG